MQESDTKSATLTNKETLFYRDINPDSTKEEAIVLVHGNYSEITWWDETVEEIKNKGYRIVVPDMRGFGQSTYHSPCSRFADWASDLLELC